MFIGYERNDSRSTHQPRRTAARADPLSYATPREAPIQTPGLDV